MVEQGCRGGVRDLLASQGASPRAGRGAARRRGLFAGDAMPIDDLLEYLGFSSKPAQREARAVLDESGLTNPRKRYIHPRKREQVSALVESRFVRICGSERCIAAMAADPRRRVPVATRDCGVCRGRRTLGAARRLLWCLSAAAINRLLIVGGSPATHAELRAAFTRSAVTLDVIDGAHPPKAGRALALVEGADIVVVWASTVLPHSVSTLFVRPNQRQKTVTVSRRGIEALADAIEKHLAMRRRWARQAS